MAYEMLTRTGKSFWECTSVMQNAIRKGDYEIAGECVWELLPKYETYLRKRFLVISAEDCYGVITKEILNLTTLAGEENVERALSVLCRAKKNRDADYFVCNLMEKGLDGSAKEILEAGLRKAVKRFDVKEAGRYSFGLFKKNRKHLWATLKDLTMEINPELMDEIDALSEANETVSKPTEETIFAAKAIILLWTKKDTLGHSGMRYDGVMDEASVEIIKPVAECAKVTGLYPDWAYNWHTHHGKYKLWRDAVHAISNDQQLLTPLEENLFDDCSWNRDINGCLTVWNPKKRKIPYDDGKIMPEEKYPVEADEEQMPEPVQMTIFDL